MPHLWSSKLYQLNSKLWLTFLARIDSKKKNFNPEKAVRYVKDLEKEWIQYDTTFI